MRAIFCGNLEFDARQSELERLFKRYGKVERVDMKSGFAFVYMEDERDAEDAVRKLDRVEFGRKGRRLRVEWTKQERDSRRPGGGKKPVSNERPSRTLFVINFDPIDTKSKDLERHFEPYGKIANIRIRKNFAFIQFETQEEATKALEATNMSELLDRVITVEYAIRDDDANSGPGPDRRGRDRDRDMSPERGGFNRRRSPSPYRKERGSPDYGRGRDRGSPDYGRGRVRDSPDYGRGRVKDSPDYGRGRVRDSPDQGRGRDRGDPPRRRGRDRASPDGRGRDRGSPDGRGRDRGSPDGRGKDRGSPDGRGRGRGSPDDHGRDRSSPNSRDRVRGSPDDFDNGRGRVRGSPDLGDGRGRISGSPDGLGRDRDSPDGRARDGPEKGRGVPKPEAMDSPDIARDESPPNGRYHSRSRSPPPRERSRS